MKRFAFVGYRSWSYEIYKDILSFQKTHPFFTLDTIITTPSSEFINEAKEKKYHIVEGNDNTAICAILKKSNIEAVFYYGWSWLVSEEILSKFLCLCLHPSPLPKYRGGSPLQHQIIQGEKMSAVSIFRMSKGIDDGDIYKQKPISLQGNIDQIFSRIEKVGSKITKDFITDFNHDKVVFLPQKNIDKNPSWKRRKAEESQLDIDELATMSYDHFYNFVRALSGPYPHAYLQFNKRLSFTKVKEYKSTPKFALLLDNTSVLEDASLKPMFVKLKNGFAKIVEYTIEKL